MDEYFFGVNAGLRRRFKNHWNFQPYTPEQLLCILYLKLRSMYGLDVKDIMDNEGLKMLRGFMYARITSEDNQQHAGQYPGEYIYRRLFADEGGSMEALASKFSDYYQGVTNKKLLNTDQVLGVLLDMVFDKDKKGVQVRALDSFDEANSQCVREYFPQIFQHADDLGKEAIYLERARDCVKTRINQQINTLPASENCDTANPLSCDSFAQANEQFSAQQPGSLNFPNGKGKEELEEPVKRKTARKTKAQVEEEEEKLVPPPSVTQKKTRAAVPTATAKPTTMVSTRATRATKKKGGALPPNF